MIQQILVIIYIICKLIFKSIYKTSKYTYKYCRILYILFKKYKAKTLQHQRYNNSLQNQIIQTKEQQNQQQINDTYSDDQELENKGLFMDKKLEPKISDSPHKSISQCVQDDESIRFDQFDVQHTQEKIEQQLLNQYNQISQLHSESSIVEQEQQYNFHQNSRCERIMMHVETLFEIQQPQIKDLLLQELYHSYMKQSDKLMQYKLINCMAFCLDRSDSWICNELGIKDKKEVNKLIQNILYHLSWSYCASQESMKVKQFIGNCNQIMLMDNFLLINKNDKIDEQYQYLFNNYEQKLLVNPYFNLQGNNILARQTSSQNIVNTDDLGKLQKYLEYDIIVEIQDEQDLQVKEFARSLCCYSKFCNYNANIQLVNCSKLTNLSLSNVLWPKILGQLNIQHLALCKVNNVDFDELSNLLKIRHLYARKITFKQEYYKNNQQSGSLVLQAVKRYYQLESLVISVCSMPSYCVINFPMKYLRALIIYYKHQPLEDGNKMNNFIIESNIAQLEELEILYLTSPQTNIKLSIRGDFQFDQLYFIHVSNEKAEKDEK